MSNWVRGLRRFGLVVINCCMALALSSTAAHAQAFSITNATKNSASKASYPTMVVDTNGNVNVVWIDSVAGLQFARSTSVASGTSLSTPVTIKGPNNTLALPAFQPQIAVYPTQPNVIEVTWAAPDPASTTTAPLYDVFAGRSDDSGANFTTTAMDISGPVALFDSPRLAFDFSGKTNIVWGRNGVWISQAQDGIHFSTPVPLVPAGTFIDTGGPRIAVSAADHIFVAWTDELAKDQAKPGDGNYCTAETKDADGNVTNTFGGNFWINETFPSSVVGGPVNISAANSRDLSNTDWKGVNPKFRLGFFGCSYDNLNLFNQKDGLLHLLWSDDTPIEDVLTSETHGTDANGYTVFSFPINLASVPAASPKVAVDKNGNFYVVWSGGPTGGTNSEGIFFSLSKDQGSTFSPALNIAPSGSIAPAFPQVAVDSSGNLNVAWEQPTKPLAGDGSDMFNVFFARSTDKGNTFPTVLQVSTNPSVLCFEAPPPPQGTGAPPTTPDVTTCGTVQIGVDANSTPDMAWVNQASGSAVADIDFATTNFPTGSVSPTTASLSASNASQNFTVTVNPSGFSGPITFSCLDADTGTALPSWLSCSFAPQTLNPAQGTTDTLTISRVGTPTSGMFISAPSSHNLPAYSGLVEWAVGFAAVWLIAMAMLTMGRRRELGAAVLIRGFVVMTLTVVLAAGLVSCGGSTSTTSTTGTTGRSGSGGNGGSGGGNSVTVHVAVRAQSGSAAPTTLGTVTITAQ
jgi:hypothetical protein